MFQRDKDSDLVLESSLQSFFFDQLNDVNRKSANPLPNETIYYSSLVMDKFGEAEEYFEIAEGRVREKVLGVKLLETSSMPKSKQKRMLRDIGDTALLLCGFFSDSLNKKLVDGRYYREVGQTAYKRLNSIVPEVYEVPCFFKQLSTHFEGLATLMSLVSQNNRGWGDEPMGEVLFVANNNKIRAS